MDDIMIDKKRDGRNNSMEKRRAFQQIISDLFFKMGDTTSRFSKTPRRVSLLHSAPVQTPPSSSPAAAQPPPSSSPAQAGPWEVREVQRQIHFNAPYGNCVVCAGDALDSGDPNGRVCAG